MSTMFHVSPWAPRTAVLSRSERRHDAIGPALECVLTFALVFCALPCAAKATDIRDTWRDDANLHAVRFTDKKLGWAVGDHGVAFRSNDGGRTWEPRYLPADLSFRAVDFISDSTGWAAGATTTPYTEVVSGAIYQTTDSGRSWQQVNRVPLPRMHALRFFSERDGIAAGETSERFASGVLVTHDGGATWESVQSAISSAASTGVLPEQSDQKNSVVPTALNTSGWKAAAFPQLDRGAVVGAQARRAVIASGQLLPGRSGGSDLRSLNALAVNDGRNGWAVGDGGTVLRTQDGGLVWQDPESPLPDPARTLFDFHAVDAVGNSIWIAGRPGSLVWRSTDGSASWQALPTGSALPIHSIDFSTETDGVAVGAMGLILRTSDGGTSWKPVRAAERRAAVMTVATRSEDLSFSLLAKLAGDEGYRTVALLPIRTGSALGKQRSEIGVHDAVIAAGGNVAVVDWPLPLNVPGLASDQNALVAEWNRVTEGRLEEILVGRLVASIRTWRPEVITLVEPEPTDAAGRLMLEATKIAITQAADPTRYVEQRSALAPWRVKKTYVRLRSGESADDVVERDGILSRIGLSVADLAGPAGARIGLIDTTASARETYRLLAATEGAPLAKPFFAGLAIASGSESRREVGEPLDRPDTALLASRQQTIRRYAAVAFDDPRQAAGLLAQIDDVTAGLTSAQASRLLFQVAEAHRTRAQWDLAERDYLAMIERYPLEPASREAMTWLLRLWTGAEPVWRRMQYRGAKKETIAGSIETLGDRINRAFQLAEAGIPATTPQQIQQAGLGADPLSQTVTPATLQVAAGVSWNDAQVAHWREQAVRLGGLIRQTDPALFSSAAVQLPLAVAVRSPGGSTADATKLLGRDFFELASNAEMILARPAGGRLSVATCAKSAVPPNLDGVFAEDCWKVAKEVRLTTDATHPMPEGILTLLSYDDQFLYVAASVPRVPDRAVPPIELAGRTHDADLSANDRLILTLDLDRDFATYFQFAVDERGETAESCWGDSSWNPQWFASVTGDEHRWRIEAAIPLADLGPSPPSAGAMWAVSIARIVPAVGTQGWPRPNDGTPAPESFGLLRFE